MEIKIKNLPTIEITNLKPDFRTKTQMKIT